MAIAMKTCKSSNVKEFGYDDSAQTLVVRFGAGTLYRYKGVPRDVYDDLLEAESIGGFISKNVRGQFEHERVDEPKDEKKS